MRVPLESSRRGIPFNITPLIDIVFLLVIFFLVASHFARSEPMEEVRLPDASQTAEDEVPRRLTITIHENGTYFVQGRAVTLGEVEQMITEGAGTAPETYAVRVRGDKAARYELVQPIMLACARARVTTFGFKVIEQ